MKKLYYCYSPIYKKMAVIFARTMRIFNMSVELPDKISFIPILISAVQNSPVSTIITDAIGNFLYVNPKFTETTGFTAQEVIGKNARIRRSERTDPEIIRSLSDAIHAGQSWSGELWNQNKAGKDYLESVLIAPIYNGQGVLTNFVGLQLDITEQRRLLEQVTASESAFRRLANSITDIYFAIDLEEKLTFWNQECEKFTGIAQEDALGKTLREIIDVSPDAHFWGEMQLALKEQKVHDFFEEVLINGVMMYWEVSCYPTGKGIAVIAKNVTERHLLAIELRKKNAELNALLEVKDKFFSIVAHDLRSPFQSMLGLSAFLTEDDPTVTFDEVKMYATKLHDTIRNTFALLQNLLEWSRMEVGKLPIEFSKLHVDTLLQQTVSTLALASQQKNIQVSITVVADLYISADRNMIASVLHNLLANAIKFTPPGGTIQLSAQETHDTVEVVITDSGVGMPPETVHNIFNLGSGVTTLGTNGEKGTGLGLILCKEMMLRQDGNISVKSAVNMGSSFTLSFKKWRE